MVVDVTTDPTWSLGRPRLLFPGPFASTRGKNYDVTADGQRFLMVQTIDPVAPKGVTVVVNWMEPLEPRLGIPPTAVSPAKPLGAFSAFREFRSTPGLPPRRTALTPAARVRGGRRVKERMGCQISS